MSALEHDCGDRVRYFEGGEAHDAGTVQRVEPRSDKPYEVEWDAAPGTRNWYAPWELVAE